MASVYQQREEGVKSSEYLLIEPRVGGLAKTRLTLPYLSTKREKKMTKKTTLIETTPNPSSSSPHHQQQ